MTRYIVRFEFLNALGEWKEDDFSNNGKGMTFKEAKETADQLRPRCESIRNTKIETLREEIER